MITSDKRAIPELSIDTQTLERRLAMVNIGNFISYADLTASIGRNVQGDARGTLNSARRRLLKSLHILFEPVFNEGLKRLDDRGKVGSGRSHVRKAHRQAKMAIAKTTAVDRFDLMPEELKHEHNMVLATAGAMKSMTSEPAQKKLAAAITDTKPRLSLRESLELMKPTL